MIGGDGVPNHFAIADAIDALDAFGHFLRDGDGLDAKTVSHALQHAAAPFEFVIGDILDGVQHEPGLMKQQGGEHITEHLHVGVHDVRLKFAEDLIHLGVDAPIESGAFAEIPDFYAGVGQGALQIRSDRRVYGDHRGLESPPVDAGSDVDGDTFTTVGPKTRQDVKDAQSDLHWPPLDPRSG